MTRVLAAALACVAAAAPLSAAVKGTVVQGGVTLRAVDGVAYERKARFGAGMGVRVSLSPVALDPAAVAAALDVEGAVQALRGHSPYIDIDFDPSGAWEGNGYALGGGNNCGSCFDSALAPKYQVRIENGVVRGTVRVAAADHRDGKGPAIDLTFDLPIVKVVGTALPADGGEPARALLACRQAMKAKGKEGVKAKCFHPDDERMVMAAQVTDEGFWSLAHMGAESLELATLKVTGGRTKGDWAEVQVEAKGTSGGARQGGVYMLRGPGGWRFHHEKLGFVY